MQCVNELGTLGTTSPMPAYSVRTILHQVGRILLTASAAWLLLSDAPCLARGHAASPSSDYLEATRVADAFLCAWRSREGETGLVLISRRLRSEAKGESWLRQFVVGISNPHHEAFEVGRGIKGNGQRYVFPVTLYEYYDGEPTGYAYSSKMEIVLDGETWKVDHLPMSSDNP